MYGNLQIHEMLEKRPPDWSMKRAPQIYEHNIGLREQFALALGRLFIAMGEKLVQTANMPPQLTKKTV
jgi:hypothetical protein